ncbi:MAG: hypothetical protein SVR08_14405 [Spirochaetota bacterium]|nr:hypothetical protein [Spirochaetota bacterium]
MFRHIFRHAYDYKLDGEKILSLAELMLNNNEMIQKDKDDFRKFLIEAVESGA